jgi:predicted NBD/HSP70 family sugar kinase
LSLYCGIDWASSHHDVAVVDDDGRVVARGRVSNDAVGFAQLLTLLAQAGDSAKDPIPVWIETDRGLWVAALRIGARRHDDTRRAAGDWNRQAQRHLFNKFLGQLHH